MAGKSAVPILLGLGAGALFLGGKKKKKKSTELEHPLMDVSTAGDRYEGAFDPKAENAFLVLDQECMEISQKINPEAHNTYITNRFHQLVSEGWDNMEQITIQLLMDQSEHCPWKDPDAWTPMMKGLYEQLLTAVSGYYEIFTGGPAPTPAEV